MTQGNHQVKFLPLASDDGQRLLREVKQNRWPYQPFLDAVFCKQSHGGACGIQSCGLLLNAAYVGKTSSLQSSVFGNIDRNKLPYTENKVLQHPATLQAMARCGLTTLYHGISLPQVAEILACHGCEVKCYFASESSCSEFIHLAKEALAHSNSSQGIIVNFHRTLIGQELPYGHHSPLGAYHEGEDRFLIFDTGREAECWVKSNVLFEAMNSKDRISRKSRGYVVMKT